MQQLLARHIDCDRQRDAAILPAAHLLAGIAGDPGAHIDDQAAVLGDLDEAVGGDFAMVRIAPAQQRLHAAQPVVPDPELGLVHQVQQVLLQGTPQPRLQVQPVAQPAAHGGRVRGDGRDDAALHLVHGGVGMLEHRLHIGTVLGIDRKSDAGG